MPKRKQQHKEEFQPSPEVDPEAQTEPVEIQEIELSEAAAELVQRLEEERDEALAARQRALADFRNYQRRAAQSEHRAVQGGAAGVVRSLLAVIDHFDLALGQDTEQITVDQLLGGVRIVRDELVKALESHGVQRIDPARGDEFDPNRHEAMMKQPADDVEPDHIVCVLQPGYQMGDLVLRPAKVAVASPQDEDD
ncbi:MAG: nucleotide exchange factor GrpE [Phycisphaerales bacterium]